MSQHPNEVPSVRAVARAARFLSLDVATPFLVEMGCPINGRRREGLASRIREQASPADIKDVHIALEEEMRDWEAKAVRQFRFWGAFVYDPVNCPQRSWFAYELLMMEWGSNLRRGTDSLSLGPRADALYSKYMNIRAADLQPLIEQVASSPLSEWDSMVIRVLSPGDDPDDRFDPFLNIEQTVEGYRFQQFMIAHLEVLPTERVYDAAKRFYHRDNIDPLRRLEDLADEWIQHLCLPE